MKILNICSILPLEGLKRENDISLKIMDEINKLDPNIEFNLIKSIPASNKFLARVKPQWAKYYQLRQNNIVEIRGYPTIIYPWLMLPTSNFKVNKFLLKINRWHYIKNIEKIILNDINSYDLILSQNNIPDSILANYLSKKYNIPHIHILRGNDYKEFTKDPELAKIFSHASQIITPSPTAFKNLKSTGLNIKLLPHGIDSEFFYSGIKNLNKPVIIIVARLLKLKNIHLVIEALHLANQKNIDFELNIIGDGPEKKNLIDLVYKYNLQHNVKFLGWLTQAEIIPYLRNSNILAMPSYPETLGRVFLEAAASQCICFGHYNTGIDGLFSDGIDCVLCNKENLNQKLIHLLENIRDEKFRSISRKGLNLTESLDWKSVAIEYINCFKSIKYD